jgi:hypothetical protein
MVTPATKAATTAAAHARFRIPLGFIFITRTRAVELGLKLER